MPSLLKQAGIVLDVWPNLRYFFTFQPKVDYREVQSVTTTVRRSPCPARPRRRDTAG